MTFVILCLADIGLSQDSRPTLPATTEYVNHALDLMRQHSINKRRIDWATLRKETLARAAGAKETYDTYDAIGFALQSLNDAHSFLQLDDKLALKDKESHERRGVASPKPSGSEKWPPSPYIDRRKPEGHIATIDGIRLAIIVVPMLENGERARMQAYANTLEDDIESLAKQNPQGWVVDLRGNLGGNMWPMLAGIAPLLTASEVGAFVDSDGHDMAWVITREGAGMKKPDGGEEIYCRVAERKLTFRASPMIAVLIDRGTASSGEAVALALRGQSRTRFFGRATHGQTTANEGFPLSDGANLVLATGIEADRTGKVYPSGINPDVELPEEANPAKSFDSDPMISAVAGWMKQDQRMYAPDR